MMRLTVPDALEVCSVPKTMCPVSAAFLHGGVNRFQIAHFTDENDVGGHTQGPANAFFEIGDIDADLALIDQALVVLVKILDRIFQRDDMAISNSGSRSSPSTRDWSSYPSRSGRSRATTRGAG